MVNGCEGFEDYDTPSCEQASDRKYDLNCFLLYKIFPY